MTWLSLRATAEQAMTTVSLHFPRLTGVSLNPVWCGSLSARLIHRWFGHSAQDAQISEKCKPRHVLRRFRDGTPAERAAADRARDSANRNYGTGSTEQGAAGAAAARAAAAC